MESYFCTLLTLLDTEKLGYILGAHCQPGFIYCLDGDLGAGKTTLTQSIAGGLNLVDGHYVTSPSFAIMHEYLGEIPLYHMDFYRLYGADDVLALGFEEYFFKSGLTVIEWSERATEILPEDVLTIKISMTKEGGRFYTFLGTSMYSNLLAVIRKYFPCNQ